MKPIVSRCAFISNVKDPTVSRCNVKPSRNGYFCDKHYNEAKTIGINAISIRGMPGMNPKSMKGIVFIKLFSEIKRKENFHEKANAKIEENVEEHKDRYSNNENKDRGNEEKGRELEQINFMNKLMENNSIENIEKIEVVNTETLDKDGVVENKQHEQEKIDYIINEKEFIKQLCKSSIGELKIQAVELGIYDKKYKSKRTLAELISKKILSEV